MKDVKALSNGIAEFLSTESKHLDCKPYLKASAKQEDVARSIEAYLRTIDDLPVTYTRNQLIADLITLIKNGNGAVSGTLIDLMGFNKVQDTYIINTINYENIKRPVMPSAEPDQK